MNEQSDEGPRVQGTVAAGFESLRERVEHDLRVLAEENVQLCVYHRGTCVVDLWASATGDAGFSADALVNVFSSGKSLAAIAMASLVGRGLLGYDTRIADHWPEFAEGGKGEITVADLMRHESGLAAFDTSIDPKDLLPKPIRENPVGAIIERQRPRFRKVGSRREYHAVTRGWIANELFRRVDPAGRTIGDYLREEISDPLEADAIIGVQESELGRISRVKMVGIGVELFESLKPRFLGRRILHNVFQILGRLFRVLFAMRHATTRGAPPPYKGMKSVHVFNEPVVAMGETPSAAANCSARGLAKIAAMMAARGRWDGEALLSESGWQALHADPVEAEMGFGATRFTQGGVNQFHLANGAGGLARDFNQGREGFYGWMGFGGSIFQWHPELEIGFAFVPTSLHVLDILNERGKAYQAEVLRCVARLAR